VSAPRFLIDENLSVKLPEVAHEAGYEAIHVNHLGLRTRKDWTLLGTIREGDWTLVTNNAMEFKGRYARVAVHAGLVLVLPNVRREQQIELFSAALATIGPAVDLTNNVIEVNYDADEIATRRYDWPE
jgi:predicted nuclease of predicted toxin-antitoxin system